VAFPTIVLSWTECSLLVNGYPNAEFKSFRRLADAEAYLFPTEGPPDFAFLVLHTPDPSTPSPPLPVFRDQLAHDAVEGGAAATKTAITKTPFRLGSPLNANAPEWHPAPI
jgi:hypothetical protein